MLCKCENIFIGPSSTWTGWTHIEHLLNTCECLWTPLSECWILHEHLWVCMKTNEWVGTAPEHLWAHMNANEWVGTPIDCTWAPLSHYWTWLTMVWPWERQHLCQNWIATEHLWVNVNAFEWILNTPWILVSARECLWVSIKHPLNTHWAHINANEWVGSAPENPLSAHKRHWVIIRMVWSCTSSVVNLTNL